MGEAMAVAKVVVMLAAVLAAAVAKAVVPKVAGAVQMADRNDQAHEAEVKAMVEVAMVEEAMAAGATVVALRVEAGVEVREAPREVVHTCPSSPECIRPPTARASPWSPVHRSHPH